MRSRAYLVKAADAWSTTEIGPGKWDDDHDGADEENGSIIDVEETDAEISEDEKE